MKGNIYKELFSLVRNEGERLVVVNPETEDGLVVLKLSEYKRLRGEGEQSTKNAETEPILAQNTDKNLSFWPSEDAEKEPSGAKLDNSVNSGRIHERNSANTSVKEPELVEESAGEEYYFEPAEEIGL